MIKATKAPIRLLSALALLGLPALMMGQSYYDDDIYYDSSKDVKTVNKPKQQTSNSSSNTIVYTGPVSYPAADTYIVNTGSTRDVDEYNRRGQFLVSDSVDVLDSAPAADTYSNTRRIQRFHNDGIIDTMDDSDYATYVLTDPAVVNVYMESPVYTSLYSPWYSPYGYGWSYGLGSPWWNLSFNFYDPWYWGPSWSIGWGPSWGWGPGWGWGPSYGWCGPGWGHTWHPAPGPSYGGNGYRPQTPAGSTRPHAIAGSGGGRVTGNATGRPAGTTTSGRVGSTSVRPVTGVTTNNNTGVMGSPSNTGTHNNTTASPVRGRNNGSSSGTTTRQSTTTNRSNSSKSSNSGYNRSSSSSSSSSSSGYNRSSSSGSSSRSSGMSGGSHSGGGRSTGGGGRGRR